MLLPNRRRSQGTALRFLQRGGVSLDLMGHLHDGARVMAWKCRAAVALALGGVGVSGSAWAQPKSADAAAPDASEPAWQKAPAARRGGFTAGFTLAGALGTAAGFPNDVKKIGREAFYTETGLSAGGAGLVWVGGALTDWFVFSVGLGMSTLVGDTTTQSSVGFMFRVEAFPLWTLGERWRDLGVMLEAGTGTTAVTANADPDVELVSGGAPSRIGAGAFFEAFRPWKLAIGPFASYGYAFSETIRRGEVSLGVRTVIYTNP